MSLPAHALLIALAIGALQVAAAPAFAQEGTTPGSPPALHTGIPTRHAWHARAAVGSTGGTEVGSTWAAHGSVERWGGDVGPGSFSWGPSVQFGKGNDRFNRQFPDRTLRRDLWIASLDLYGRFTVDLHPVFRPYVGAGPGIYYSQRTVNDTILGTAVRTTNFRGGFGLVGGAELRLSKVAGIHVEGIGHGSSDAYFTALAGADLLF